MRYAFAALLLMASSASAEPWTQPPDLSRDVDSMAESPDKGPSGERDAKGYFERLDRAGFNCDAQDKAPRRIVIQCSNGRENSLTYRCEFVGAGYLDLAEATVDGHRLSKSELIRHQSGVWSGELRSPPGRRLPASDRRGLRVLKRQAVHVGDRRHPAGR